MLAVTGCSPELDGKTPLLKEPHILVIRHGEIKLVLTKSIFHESQLSEYSYKETARGGYSHDYEKGRQDIAFTYIEELHLDLFIRMLRLHVTNKG